MNVCLTPRWHPFTDGPGKGERAYQKAPRNWGKNITLISSIGKERGMGASLVVEGSTNGTVFETYLEEVLLPTLERVMNLGANRIGMRIPRSAWFLRDLRFPHS